MSFSEPLGVAALSVLGWGHLETWLLRITETEFRSPEVPEEFDGYRIALVGGLHLRRIGTWARWLQRTLTTLQPDILLLAGNVKPSHRADNQRVHDLLRKWVHPLRLPDGILAVRGYRDKKRFWENLPEASPIRLLSNSHVTLRRGGASLHFCGIATAHAAHLDRGINYLRQTLAAIDEKGFTILVGQSPDLLRIAQGQSVRLILAVDTLHYQVRIPGIGVPRRDSKVPYSWTRGWLREGPVSLYLSPGVGTRWLPFRFFLRPEITCVTLRHRS